MGLSSKQVSGEGFHWGESLMQTGALQVPKLRPPSGPPLKCPRCESTNTKFCYFNNYNQSQPRHFCKGCKRHWTKGGTLRDVPVGGGRRNKRLKTKSAAPSQERETVLPLRLIEEKKFHDILHQSFLQPTTFLQPFSSAVFMHSGTPPPNLLSTAFTSLNNTSSFATPFGLSMVSNYSDEAKYSETTIATTMTLMPVQWHTPTPSNTTDTSSYWNLEDFNTLMSTDADEPWDDSLEQ